MMWFHHTDTQKEENSTPWQTKDPWLRHGSAQSYSKVIFRQELTEWRWTLYTWSTYKYRFLNYQQQQHASIRACQETRTPRKRNMKHPITFSLCKARKNFPTSSEKVSSSSKTWTLHKKSRHLLQHTLWKLHRHHLTVDLLLLTARQQ